MHALRQPNRYCEASMQAPCGLVQFRVPSVDQVRDGNCPFLAQEKPQEAASSPSKPSVNSTSAINSWKLQKWFTAAGQEDCNLYQRKLCNLGEAYKRAHVCKACRGYHPQADCPRSTGNQVTVKLADLARMSTNTPRH